jgi:hypothetical protein
MNTPLRWFASILLSLLAATSAFSQEKLKADEGNGVKTYSPTDIAQKSSELQNGQLVRIKFNYRLAQISDARNTGAKIGFAEARDNFGINVRLEIPAEGVEWFERVKTYTPAIYDDLSAKSYLAYGRIALGKKGVTIRLVGTEIKHDDFDGDSIIWTTP